MMARALVIIPVYRPRPDLMEAAFVRQNLRRLAAYPGAWVLPHSLDVAPYRELAPHFGIERFPDAFFQGIEGYNRLMLSEAFYERWRGYSHVLICQTDALVLRPGLDEFLEGDFDYVGAPLPEDMRLPKHYFPGAGRLMRALPWLVPGVNPRVGNGGLSLRRVEATLALLRRDALRVRLWRLYEDLYFSSRACDGQSGFVAATREVARRFCAETNISDWVLDPAQRPFGLHKPQAYGPGVLHSLLREFGEDDAANLLPDAHRRAGVTSA